MSHRPPGRRPLRERLPPQVPEDDETARLLVLTLVVASHPEGISILDLALELSAGEGDDSVERAARDLAAAGLLRFEGRLAFVTFLDGWRRPTR